MVDKPEVEKEESIGETLAAAIAEHREVEQPESKPGAKGQDTGLKERPQEGEGPSAQLEKPERKPPLSLKKPPAGERPRGPDGKFLKDEEIEGGKPAAKPAERPEAKPAAKPEAEEKPEGEPAAPRDRAGKLAEATKTWTEGDRAMLASLPEAAQDFMLRRHEALTQDYTRKLQKMRSFQDEYGPVDQMFAPHRDMLKQNNQTPRMVIEGWAEAEKALIAGGERAINMLAGIANGYRIPLDKVAAKLGIQIGPASAQPQPQPGGSVLPNGQQGQPPAFRDPRLDPLLARFEREDRERAERAESERIAAHNRALESAQTIQRQIDEFAEATDTEGNLLHPEFEHVENEMAALYAADVQAKRKPRELEQLYQDAVFANTETRERHLAAVRQQEADRQAREARGRAERARNAASSVTGAPRGAGGQPSKAPPAKQGEESIGDTIKAAIAEVRERAE